MIGTLERLSDTYSSISRFMDQLTQNEKLASLGELVAQVAKQIKNAVAVIRELVFRVTSPPDTEPPIRPMAGKIGQYGQRTDDVVENMLRFAQETPLQLTPVEVRSLIESALHLSRVAKFPHIFVSVGPRSWFKETPANCSMSFCRLFPMRLMPLKRPEVAE